jgi:hypothetical protein
MVPAQPANTASAAERFVFERIRDELPGEWTALHSVGLAIHNAKPWAEIDFVLIGPPGVFCLEVKGGTITREAGLWYTEPRHGPNAGRRQRLKESPFEQVGSAAAALFHFLVGKSDAIRNAIAGYAVAAPDVAWTAQGPDVDPALVYEQSDTLRSFEEFMQRVTGRWAQKVGSSWNRKLEPLGRSDKQQILDFIRGDFQLVPSLRASADLAQRELLRLTTEQCELFARLAANDRVIASGGAGTGKTVIAVEEARRLAANGQRVLYTCFSRNLAAHIAALVSETPSITVRTLHGLMMDVVEDADRRADLPDVSEDDLMALFLPELAFEVLVEGVVVPGFDAVIIDETQDLLRDAYLDVIEALVGGDLKTSRWRVFLDPNQNIFGGVAAEGLGRIRAAKPVEWPLTVNCRNTAPIAAQVSLLSGTPLSEVLAPEGPDVEIVWYDAVEEEARAIAMMIRKLTGEGFAPERIAILSRYRLENSVAGDSDLRLTDVSRGGASGPSDISFSTVASFKGLEADVVLLVDVDDLSSNEGLSSVYVGASRARVELIVFISSGVKQRFQDLAKEFGRALVERPA